MFLVMIQAWFVIDPPGRVLGADALLRHRREPGPSGSLSWVS
jgi:hypothetical protein